MNSAILSVTLPVLPIKRTVLFPGILIPVTVGRERSMAGGWQGISSRRRLMRVKATWRATRAPPPRTDRNGSIMDNLLGVASKLFKK